MTAFRRFVSSALLIGGVALVVAGFSASLGFTPAGFVACVASIASLLDAGAVWFGSSPVAAAAEPIVVFDRALRVVSGAARGRSITAHFSRSAHGEIERRCAAALLGEPSHFTCGESGRVMGYDVAPVRGVDGTVVCGVLIAGTAAPTPDAAACTVS